MKAGALLLFLGIPFALYAAWQVNGATHIGATAPDAPADKTATKEQLAASGAKATAWAGESRKAVEVTWQYRTAAPADASRDAPVNAVVEAASARAADLNDLDRFLSDVEKPTFTGKLKARYDQWTVEQAAIRADAQAVTDWLARPPQVTSAEDADAAMLAVGKLIDTYVARSRFSDKGKATVWKLRARLAITDTLAKLADAQYQAAVRVKLPLKPGANEGVVAVATLGALKAQIAALGADLRQADTDKVPMDATFRTAASARSEGADEYTAREELLALFAKSDLFDNAGGATAWLKLVAVQYAKTDKNPKVQALIREKVQEFADAFIPPAARLDDNVLIRGKPAPRAAVKIKFEKESGGGFVMPKELSANPSGFNEFEVVRKAPGFNSLVTFAASEYDLKDLAPTDASKAAVAYNAARARLADRATAPRWTPESVEELKKACEAQKDLVDQLRTLDTGTVQKIATRVAGLAAGMDACKELFAAGP